MLSWFFKKRDDLAAAAAPAPKAPPRGAAASAAPAAATPRPSAEEKAQERARTEAEWSARLHAASGDDAQLLALAGAAPLLQTKLDAVQALAGEAALREAERAFRSHDRRVHKLARQRLDALVAQRQARAGAQQLIEAATALAGEPLLALNRLAEIDREWHALPAAALEAGQQARWDAARAAIDAAVREQGDRQRRAQQWLADATRACAALQAATLEQATTGAAGALAPGLAAALEPVIAAAQELAAACPQAPSCTGASQALQAAIEAAQRAAQAAAQAAIAPPPQAPGESEAQANAADTADATDAHPTADAVAPAGAGDTTTAPARKRGPRPEPLSPEQRTELDALLAQAETAQAEGEPGLMQQHLQQLDTLLATLKGSQPAERWRIRHQALLAERARLNAWRQWGAERARDDLVAEAEALARQTLAATDPEATHAPKLRLKEHAAAIHSMRLRWKELDRLGAAAGHALWLRFDAALTAAHQPVAAQQAVLKATREENLRQRQALLDELQARPAAPPDGTEAGPFWKEHLHVLGAFHTAWRQLGPIEHTVPAAARKSITQRVQQVLAEAEGPLETARARAMEAREQLIAQAEALVPQDAPPPPDAVPRVRDLQAAWQQQARALPLARAAENALWGRFRAATDALFARREAVFLAREAEFAQHAAARNALLEEAQALAGSAPLPELRHRLAELDRAWRQAPEPPRAVAAAQESRYRQAREAALRRLDNEALWGWQARCDALAARLALCEAREDAAAAADAPDDAAWDAAVPPAALPDLPPHDGTRAAMAAWNEALVQRRAAPAGAAGPLGAAAFDELLLALEAALDLPATAEQLAARRQLKLLALKATFEGGAAAVREVGVAQRVGAALRQAGTGPAQRTRLATLLAALRAAPGALARPR